MTEEVLLLDDDLTTLTFLEGVLSGAGFKCSVSGDPQQALATVAAREEIAVVEDEVHAAVGSRRGRAATWAERRRLRRRGFFVIARLATLASAVRRASQPRAPPSHRRCRT